MLGAIRRVISGDALDNNNADAAAAHQPPTEGGTGPNTHNHNHGNSSPHPIIQTAVVVEHDNNDNDNCTTSSSLSDASTNGGGAAVHHHEDREHEHSQHHHQHNNNNNNNDDRHQHHHPVIADVYMDDAMMDDASPTPLAGHHQQQQLQQSSNIPPAHYQQHLEHRIMAMGAPANNNNNSSTVSPARRMQRMNSSSSDDGGGGAATTASQNSSRDWGWFEEWGLSVGSEGGGSRRAGSGGGGGGGSHGGHHNGRGGDDDDQPIYRMVVGLDPRDDNEASAMAVTAPTYVLEESMSSQRLWKDSAGRRPPQPVEERAFYEQMWAQNFAKSQVNYYMPSEVLTATTPVSLSPFAEGGTMEMSPEEAASDGNNNYQYNMNIHAPADTHNMMVMPSSAGGDTGGAGGGSDFNHSWDAADAEGSGLGPGGGLKETPRATAPNVLPPTKHQHIVNKTAKTESGEEMRILVRGDNVFGTTVSKSFALSNEKGGAITNVVTVNISIASYRVVESRKRGKYAQFLVIYREGSIRDTIGVWKRYSDFDDLARKVTQAHEGCASVIANMSPLAITEEHEVEHLPNAITSWRLLKKRQRWYRCLDSGYLSLKVFLLERFLHDILFESSSPQLLREFVGGPDDV